jgi:hypothetical protein
MAFLEISRETMRVNLRRWMKANSIYVGAWIAMGLATLGLILRELGVYTLVLILSFLPPFIVAMVRMAQELRK